MLAETRQKQAAAGGDERVAALQAELEAQVRKALPRYSLLSFVSVAPLQAAAHRTQVNRLEALLQVIQSRTQSGRHTEQLAALRRVLARHSSTRGSLSCPPSTLIRRLAFSCLRLTRAGQSAGRRGARDDVATQGAR